ncbi:hypothetical protein TNCV_2476861 [Trichonephila clavipes]|nr:hypothetical protein TNCV_2476861 [Trichonephila clavipes]
MISHSCSIGKSYGDIVDRGTTPTLRAVYWITTEHSVEDHKLIASGPCVQALVPLKIRCTEELMHVKYVEAQSPLNVVVLLFGDGCAGFRFQVPWPNQDAQNYEIHS